MTKADFGGIGSDEHRTATGTAALEWRPATHFSLGAGYGFLYLRVEGDILSKPVFLKQTLHGPLLSLGIPF
jgi:hypothetical protein